MGKIIIIIVIIVGICGAIIYAKTGLKSSQKKDDPFPVLKGEYLGQKKPGLEPEVFAPGIISTNEFELGITFSPDGKEVFFVREKKSTPPAPPMIMHMKLEENGWTPPGPAPFSHEGIEFEPNFSPDGKKLFYHSNRPMPGKKKGDFAIWVVEKTDSGWGEPQPLGSPVNDDFAMYVTSTNDGTLYYTGKGGIFRTRWTDDRYSKPEKLGEAINYLNAAHPFIAPDESYLIFDAGGPSPQEGPDLYVSFKKVDGSWSKAKNMGASINSKGMEMCASVSPDGKFLFFARNGNIYWVDAKIIENLKD